MIVRLLIGWKVACSESRPYVDINKKRAPYLDEIRSLLGEEIYRALWMGARNEGLLKGGLGSLRNLPKLSSPLTLKILGIRRWSIKLAPTAGLSTRTGIFSALRSAAFPMPDNWSICVVPIVPADRMTSLRAFTVVRTEPPKGPVL